MAGSVAASMGKKRSDFPIRASERASGLRATPRRRLGRRLGTVRSLMYCMFLLGLVGVDMWV